MPHSNRRKVVKPSRMKASYIVAALAAVVLVGGALFYLYAGFGHNASGAVQNAGSTATTTTSSTTPASTSTGSLIYARVDTTQGTFEVELFPDGAPKTVANWVSLANSGFFNNLVWHRIVQGFVIQTGDPNSRNAGGNPSLWGTGGSNTTVPLEIDPNLHNYVGYLGMARSSDPNSGSSQWYINLANNTSLDNSYTVFGKVISGIDVVNAIGNLPVTSSSQPVNPQQALVTRVTILSAP